jgi:hypothetical protein
MIASAGRPGTLSNLTALSKLSNVTILEALDGLDARWGQMYDFAHQAGRYVARYWEGGEWMTATDPAMLARLVRGDYWAHAAERRPFPWRSS